MFKWHTVRWTGYTYVVNFIFAAKSVLADHLNYLKHIYIQKILRYDQKYYIPWRFSSEEWKYHFFIRFLAQ